MTPCVFEFFVSYSYRIFSSALSVLCITSEYPPCSGALAVAGSQLLIAVAIASYYPLIQIASYYLLIDPLHNERSKRSLVVVVWTRVLLYRCVIGRSTRIKKRGVQRNFLQNGGGGATAQFVLKISSQKGRGGGGGGGGGVGGGVRTPWTPSLDLSLPATTLLGK